MWFDGLEAINSMGKCSVKYVQVDLQVYKYILVIEYCSFEDSFSLETQSFGTLSR